MIKVTSEKGKGAILEIGGPKGEVLSEIGMVIASYLMSYDVDPMEGFIDIVDVSKMAYKHAREEMELTDVTENCATCEYEDCPGKKAFKEGAGVTVRRSKTAELNGCRKLEEQIGKEKP